MNQPSKEKLRNQYLNMRNNNSLDLSFFYEIYLLKTQTPPIDFNNFIFIFQMYFKIHGESILSLMDYVLSINKILDKNNKVIKFY